ncbi:porin [Pontibacter vulgaris]|uniref:porin n=1 Tax=Pontibacter vulgaris TaxID=2905679 RepID=UPI001FA756EB|nr:porin [Pontibacter vulgaris]
MEIKQQAQRSINNAVFVLLLILLSCFGAFAQSDSIQSASPEVKFSGFADIFYAYDFNEQAGNSRQPFFYNHNRHNEFNLNLALLRAAITHTKYRGAIALQAGTYASDNYAAEDNLLQHVFEANAGVALNTKGNLWLDAGIFGSHIGFESAISMDNSTLTRSILAENSPYFLSGAKVTYTPNDNWALSAIICNGWQRIKRVEGNSRLSYCTQVSYTNGDTYTLNWSTFAGTDDPDTTRRMRYFNNLYGKFQLTKNFALTTGFDIGIQQKYKGSSSYNLWYSPVVIARYQLNQNWATAARAEYYSDKNGVIIAVPEGFKTSGASVNLDYTPAKSIICRAEARWLKSNNKIYVKDNQLVKDNFFLAGSIAFGINR